jgi:preprotein translocase subunit SecY
VCVFCTALFLDPFHVLFYGVLLLSTSAVFAKIWVEVSGTSPRGVAKDLKEQQLVSSVPLHAMLGHSIPHILACN